MTYDYADWDDEDYGDGETAVTLSLEGGAGFNDTTEFVTFVTKALGGDVTLRFAVAPEDTLDLIARIVRFTGVSADEVHRVAREAHEDRVTEV